MLVTGMPPGTAQWPAPDPVGETSTSDTGRFQENRPASASPSKKRTAYSCAQNAPGPSAWPEFPGNQNARDPDSRSQLVQQQIAGNFKQEVPKKKIPATIQTACW